MIGRLLHCDCRPSLIVLQNIFDRVAIFLIVVQIFLIVVQKMFDSVANIFDSVANIF